MGWISVVWKIFLDKARAEWLDFLFEILWAALNLAVTVTLWGSLLPKVSVWGVDTVIAFAIFLEIFYVALSPIRDLSWAYIDILVEGWIVPLTKPMKNLYIFLSNVNAGEMAANLLKLIVLLGVLSTFPQWWLGLGVFLVGLLVYVGFEMVTVSLSYFLLESGRLWDFMYTINGRLVHTPAALFKGIHRLIVTLLFPVYFYVTLPAEIATGTWDAVILFLPAALLLWLGGGCWFYRRVMEELQAYGG